jgi:competence protein ComGC
LLYLFACLLNIPEARYKVIANKEKKEKRKAHINERQEKAVCIIQMMTVMVVVVAAAVVLLLVLVNIIKVLEMAGVSANLVPQLLIQEQIATCW